MSSSSQVVGIYSNQMISNNKDLKVKRFTKTFDLSQIAEDPMDIYLDTLGLWKKRIARDGSCLFRAVAEQIYPCQSYHEKVRLECIAYMSKHREEYSKFITTISFDEYLDLMRNPMEYGGQLEIAAMSKLYRRDFIIYQHQDQPGIDATQNNYELKINLCYSYNNHFDAIFTKAHRDRLALIQSLVYEILYDKVFGSGEQVNVARRLLRKSDTIYPKEYMLKSADYDGFNIADDEEFENSCGSLDLDINNNNSLVISENDPEYKVSDNVCEEKEEKSIEINEDDGKINKNSMIKKKTNETDQEKQLQPTNLNSTLQKMPLPYKVAKSLDPVIYRNTAFDAWLAAKKEHEEIMNQKAISVLQHGDKCLVKLNNNYNEKWNLAFVHSLMHDSANVYLPELNEHYCIPFEHLKAYSSNSNDYHHSSIGHFNNSNFPNNNKEGTGKAQNSIQNVQKFVQSINSQFSKIFINNDNKRKNIKKKQQQVSKSSSFHAFTTELPTLVEVEEQNDDLFFYSGNLYNNQHHNSSYLNNHHSLPHIQQQGGLNNNTGIINMNNSQQYCNNSNTSSNQSQLNNNSYFSLPHIQTNTSSSSISNQNNYSSEHKYNSNTSKIKLSTSSSTSALSALANNLNNNNNGVSYSSKNSSTTNSSLNKSRRQRFNNNNNSQANNSNSNQGSMTPNKKAWTNNSSSSNISNNNHSQLSAIDVANVSFISLQHQQHHSLPVLQQQSHLTTNMFNPSTLSIPPTPSMPPLIPGPGPSHQNPYLPQLPLVQAMHPSTVQPFINHHPSPLGPPAPGSIIPPPRSGYYNSMTSPFMYVPPPPPAQNSMQQSLQQQADTSSFYLSGPNLTNNNTCSTLNNNSKSNNNNPSLFERKRHESVDSVLTNPKSIKDVNNSNNSNAIKFQQQFTQNNMNNPNSTKNEFLAQTMTSQPNTSTYLLMPAPPANTSGTNNSNTGISRSQSHHSGITTANSVNLSYENNNINANTTANNNNNNNNVFIDVYNMQQQQTGIATQQQNLIPNSLNSNNMSSNNINNANQPQQQVYSNSSTSNSTNSNMIGFENNFNSLNYGATSSFTNYEVQYPRFENNSLLNNTGNTAFIDDSFLLNSTDARQQANLWNKNNKLGANDMAVYPQAPVTGNESNQPSLFAASNQQNYCYTNCFVVNIDGPINFNSTHSLMDDGGDLPLNDVNTMRFFYNLGIEYYRLNLATPYGQPPPSNFSTPCFTSAPSASSLLVPVPQANKNSSLSNCNSTVNSCVVNNQTIGVPGSASSSNTNNIATATANTPNQQDQQITNKKSISITTSNQQSLSSNISNNKKNHQQSYSRNNRGNNNVTAN